MSTNQDDQDEEVEEEEEFHEVEEEKHRASQESIGGVKFSSPTRQLDAQSQSQQQQPVEKQQQKSAEPPNNNKQQQLDCDPSTCVENKNDATPTSTPVQTTTTEQTQPNGQVSDPQQEPSLMERPQHQLDDCEEPIAPAPTPASIADASMTVNIGDFANLSQQKLNESFINADVVVDDMDLASEDKDEQHSSKMDSTAELLTAVTTAKLSDDNINTDSQVSNEDIKVKAVEDEPSDVQNAETISTSTSTSDVKPRFEKPELDWADIMSPNSCQKDSSVEVEVESSLSATDLEAVTDAIYDSEHKPLASQGSMDENQELVDKPVAEDDKTEEAAQDAKAGGDDINEVEQRLKELDLDEDVKNPQYIPKKGGFYEHDDRSHDTEEKKQPNLPGKKSSGETNEAKGPTVKTNAQEKSNDSRRGRRQRTDVDRWNHDLFKDEKQKPKSKSELMNAYGYDIRQERGSRNKSVNNQDNQRSRPGGRDGRARDGRLNQTTNRSHDRKTRRPNNSQGATNNSSNQNNNNNNSNNNNNINRVAAKTEPAAIVSKRDNLVAKSDLKVDQREVKPHDVDEKKSSYQVASTSSQQDRREQVPRDRNVRNDVRGRRRNSRDRPNQSTSDDKLPPINTVMPSITVWSNEDMAKADAMSKTSPSRNQVTNTFNNSLPKNRSGDYWQINQSNKSNFHSKPARNLDENRHQHQHQQQYYNSRNRYQDRDDLSKTGGQFMGRGHFNDRSNQPGHDWRRTNNSGNYAKTNEYEVIKTQTFENSRLAQANLNRQRDLREIINEKRVQGQHNFPSKMRQDHTSVGEPPMHHHVMQPPHPAMMQHAPPITHQQQQQQHLIRQHHQQQNPLLLLQQQQQQPQQSQIPPTQHHQPQVPSSQHHQPQPPTSQHQLPTRVGQQRSPPQPSQQPTSQPQQTTPQGQHQHQARPNIVMAGLPAEAPAEAARLADASGANDLVNSRPIVKTDGYTTSSMASHSQPLSQHSQNHRTMGGPMSHQNPNPAGSHIVPSHMNAGAAQTQYYTPSNSSRDSTAAALASAYHGYIPGGPSVMDSTRYHMTSQQLSDHGYTNDVTASVLHQQQGIYADAASAGGTVASSTYLAQTGSTLSPSTNIPVTGAGPPPPLPPVSYLQHSQYAAYPYSQPQHNQPPPPQSSHAYPYWAPYI